jgi:hypothetical protein
VPVQGKNQSADPLHATLSRDSGTGGRLPLVVCVVCVRTARMLVCILMRVHV